jgi:hypothetical protein
MSAALILIRMQFYNQPTHRESNNENKLCIRSDMLEHKLMKKISLGGWLTTNIGKAEQINHPNELTQIRYTEILKKYVTMGNEQDE